MSALNAEFAFHISDERVVIFVAVLRSAVVSDDARPTKALDFCFVVRDDCFTHELSMDRKVLPCVFGNQEPDVGLVDTLCCFSFLPFVNAAAHFHVDYLFHLLCFW